MSSAQRRQRTAYLGPEASFSHQAAVEALPATEPIPIPSFRAILSSIQEQEHDYAVLPVENSTNGSVVQALDLLALCGTDTTTSQYPDIEVINEHYLEVHHYLFVSRALAQSRISENELHVMPCGLDAFLARIVKHLNIKTLHTHPQVWGQCNNVLSTFLPPGHVERVDMSSTSAAAAFVANQGAENECAAISSSLAGQKHGQDLVCVARNIEDEPGANTTRFLVLRNRKSTASSIINGILNSEMKSLWTFTILNDDEPGALARTLAIFAQYQFNLCAIQSRPEPKTKAQDESVPSRRWTWKYVFFTECLYNNPSQDCETAMQNVLDALKETTRSVSLLGSWNAVHP